MSPYPQGPILFCYDGSEGSRHAMRAAASLLAPRDAVVLSVWETVAIRLATGGLLPLAGMSYISDEGDLDAREQAAAQKAAEEGAAAATEQGWRAAARAANAELATWRTIVDIADEIDAALIVCGARGLNLAKRAIIGSVSEAVLHHSHRPTLIAARLPVDD
jgi:nucleotide-binding universal stress UspA family protein